MFHSDLDVLLLVDFIYYVMICEAEHLALLQSVKSLSDETHAAHTKKPFTFYHSKIL